MQYFHAVQRPVSAFRCVYNAQYLQLIMSLKCSTKASRARALQGFVLYSVALMLAPLSVCAGRHCITPACSQTVVNVTNGQQMVEAVRGLVSGVDMNLVLGPVVNTSGALVPDAPTGTPSYDSGT